MEEIRSTYLTELSELNQTIGKRVADLTREFEVEVEAGKYALLNFNQTLKVKADLLREVQKHLCESKLFNITNTCMQREHVGLCNVLNATYPRYHENVRAVQVSINRTLQLTGVQGLENFTLNMIKVIEDGNVYIEIKLTFDVIGAVVSNETGTYFNCKFRAMNASELCLIEDEELMPSKALFIDLSALDVPLQQWERTYDEATNKTTFRLVIKEIKVSQPYGSVSIDPEATLVVYGKATGSGDAIIVSAVMPPVAPVVPMWTWLLTAAIIAVVVLSVIAVAVRRK
jgi:hypothetical protein